jgi:hypothetical protein
MKMAHDAPIMALVASNFDFLCDVEIYYFWCVSFPCWKLSIPWWSLPNFVMCFLFDFVATMKICQVDVHTLYVDLVFAFNDDIFQGFHGLVETNHDNICMKWIIDLHIEIDHLGFEFNG